jgi:hypothetical protein
VQLAALGARLSERADQINQITLQDLAEDLRTSATCCEALSPIRTELSQIVEQRQDDGMASELRALLGAVKG